jgi:purine-binding chemotaxis protein CheW
VNAAQKSGELHLLVRAGADLCALPVHRIRRIVRELPVSPLPGAAPELRGLAEFGGEPMPVLDLVRLVGAAPGANPTYPLIVVGWAGPDERRELVGFAVDAVLEVANVVAEAIVPAAGGWFRGDVSLGGRAVRVLDPEELGARS